MIFVIANKRNSEKIAGLSKADARDKLMQMTERDIKQDLAGLVAKEQKEIKHDIDEAAQALLLTAMERMSSEVTADRTVTALKLPDDDMKGRIIGKEGRNIQALQRATGVDIMVDDTPGMVVLSSFDPIRRQVARYALERLMKDGRINPAQLKTRLLRPNVKLKKKLCVLAKMLLVKSVWLVFRASSFTFLVNLNSVLATARMFCYILLKWPTLQV